MTRLLDLTPSGIVFPEGVPTLTRDRIGAAEDRSETYDQRYDFHTLFYDACHDEAAGEVILVCPSLLNFRPLIEETEFSIDGAPAPLIAIDPLSRGDLIRLAAPERPRRLTFRHPLYSGEAAIGARHLDHFHGLNCVYAISKNNRLEWIADWLTYYVENHGLQAALIIDNASDAYSREALAETLATVPGIEAAALIRADFPFGPGGAGNANFNSKFLHMTMVELARRRLLAEARAVLNVDIDELVISRSARSIFDATVDSPQGYLRIGGQWAYALPPYPAGFPRHADHRYARKDGKPRVNRKYCVAPAGPMGDRPWLTHRIGALSDPETPEFTFRHMRQLSTGWDYARDHEDPGDLVEDRALIRALSGEAPAGPPLLVTHVPPEAPHLLHWTLHHRRLGFTDILAVSDAQGDAAHILDLLDRAGLVTLAPNRLLRRGPLRSAMKLAREHQITKAAGWLLVLTQDDYLATDADLAALIAETGGADALRLPTQDGARVLFRAQPAVAKFGPDGPAFHPGVAADTVTRTAKQAHVRGPAPATPPDDPAEAARLALRADLRAFHDVLDEMRRLTADLPRRDEITKRLDGVAALLATL